MVTWFVAFLVLDERRRTRSQGDVICCFVTKNQACCACCAPREDRRPAWSGDESPAGSSSAVGQGRRASGSPPSPWGFIGCSQLEIDADNDFIPAGSYVKDWFADTNAYFAAGRFHGCTRDVIVIADGAALMLAASTAFKADPYVAETSAASDRVVQRPSRCHHRRVRSRRPRCRLHRRSSGMPFKGDIVWRNETNNVPNEGIISTRMRGNHVKSHKSDDKVVDGFARDRSRRPATAPATCLRFPTLASLTSSTSPSPPRRA